MDELNTVVLRPRFAPEVNGEQIKGATRVTVTQGTDDPIPTVSIAYACDSVTISGRVNHLCPHDDTVRWNVGMVGDQIAKAVTVLKHSNCDTVHEAVLRRLGQALEEIRSIEHG